MSADCLPSSPLRPVWAATSIALAGALALSACAPDDSAEFESQDVEAAGENDGDQDTSTPEGRPTEEESEEPGNEETETQDAEESESVDSDAQDDSAGAVDPDDAIETPTYSVAKDGVDGEITVGYHHLRAEGQTMELLLTFTPEYEGDGTYHLWDLHASNHNNVAPVLYDRENLKRYNILRSGGGFDHNHWATAQNSVFLASGDTQAYWANFAVPEDEIDTINIGLPLGPEFKDVEIDWGDSEVAEGDTSPEDFDEDEGADQDAGDEEGE